MWINMSLVGRRASQREHHAAQHVLELDVIIGRACHHRHGLGAERVGPVGLDSGQVEGGGCGRGDGVGRASGAGGGIDGCVVGAEEAGAHLARTERAVGGVGAFVKVEAEGLAFRVAHDDLVVFVPFDG